uniref:Uncharacterized protein n=1 Tax=Oryza meridionalis TaxID=40149 RepID=A0A0E0DK32_9ORYZ
MATRGRACVRAAHITPAAWRWTDRPGWGGGRRIRDLVYAGTRGDLQTPVVPIAIPLQADLVYLVRERKADKNAALRFRNNHTDCVSSTLNNSPSAQH